MNELDQRTRMLDRALDAVLAKNPARTGLGVLLGCTLSFLVEVFSPALETNSFVDFSAVAGWAWLAPGILIMHLPTIVSLFKQSSIGNDELDLALELISRGNFSEAERRQQFRRLIDRVIDVAVAAQSAAHAERAIASSQQTQSSS